MFPTRGEILAYCKNWKWGRPGNEANKNMAARNELLKCKFEVSENANKNPSQSSRKIAYTSSRYHQV